MAQLCFDFKAEVAPTQRQQRGQLAYLAGLAAEDQVGIHYSRRGYETCEARWRGKAGEIDLILRHPAVPGFIFVEVKQSKTFDRALQHLGCRQQRRLMRAAQEYLGDCGAGPFTDMRFDVALVDGIGDISLLEGVIFDT
ncbi:YraN family protein [Thalassobius sp. Cn5-15]|uniref:YraN family protein n=1 Tax=Thalassobius sp. Cn5-15 TaxID=2917763 RepID=UPI001EF3076D|nr:YraN family protein [Thalassobius sp. Cn5-15]MCG7493693.1 YraN family protein [Thalassobius sp. Cn5-15]